MKKWMATLILLGVLRFEHATAQAVVCDVASVTEQAKIPSSPFKKSVGQVKNPHVRKIVKRTIVYPLTVIALTGDVQRERGGSSQPIGVGESLYLNDVVVTGRDGFVSLRLGDGTVNALPPNARVKLSQVDAYTARYELLKGRVESRVVKSPNAKKSTFEIRLPTVSIGVRGTHFSVAYEENGIIKAEVIEGLVRIHQRNTCSTPLFVRRDESVRLDFSNWQVRPLLKSPQLVDKTAPQRADGLAFYVTSVAGAKKYVAQVANDADFLDIQREFSSSDEVIRLPDDGLPDGFYYVRLAAEDELGLRGQTQQYVFLRNRE